MINNEEIKRIFGVQEAYTMPEKVMDILMDKDKREEVFAEFLKIQTDMSYDWFTDYFQQEHGDRDRLKQDYTPDCICEIMTRLIKKTDNFADICAGTGGLTIKIIQKNEGAYVHCEELSSRAIPLLLFNLAIRNVEGEVWHGDVLTRKAEKIYKLKRGERFSKIEVAEEVEEREYKTVVMNPPYSVKWSGESDERFMDYGIAPKSKADYAFVLHGLSMMQEGGELLAILPTGVLFRGQQERIIREKLAKKHMIDCIVGLPEKLFLNTQIPVLILKLKQNCKDTLIINAEKQCEKRAKQNAMQESHIRAIADIYINRFDVDKLSKNVGLDEIKENDFNLNIPRYVDTSEPEEVEDIDKLFSELQKINREINETELSLLDMLKEMTGTTLESEKKLKKSLDIFEDIIKQAKGGQMEIEWDKL